MNAHGQTKWLIGVWQLGQRFINRFLVFQIGSVLIGRIAKQIL